MTILKIGLKLAGKDDFELDARIGFGYLARLAVQYGMMLARGAVRSFGYRSISHRFFLGKRVRLLNKSSLCVGDGVRIHSGSLIDALSEDGVTIGPHSVIGENCTIQSTGSLARVGKGIMIGSNTTFGSDCFFGAAGGIQIGNDVLGGQCIRFHSENHIFDDISTPIRQQGVSHQGIAIGNDCWIGAGAVFLDGSGLGNGCVVAANAVVTKRFPDHVVVGGVPAKIISCRGV